MRNEPRPDNNTPIGPMVAIPYSDMVDANQVHRDELDRSLSLNTVSMQTAAAIGMCSFVVYFLKVTISGSKF